MKQSSDTSPKKSPRIIAAIPAFNEVKYIGTVVLSTQQHVDEVLVVDDGSADQTANVARLAGATVFRHQQNMGYGASIRRLFAEAKKRKPDILVLLDADAQHDPGDIPRLIRPIQEGYDLVIGSRKAQSAKIPRYRRFGQRIIAYFSGILSGKKLFDSECGFRVFSGKAITTLDLKENGMAISAETIADAAEKGLKITALPVSISYTGDGSTLNPLLHGLQVIGRIMAMISEKRPIYFFGLGGAILSLLGLIAGLRVIAIAYAGGGVSTGTALVSILLITIGVFSVFTGIILHVLSKRRG